MQSEVAWLLGSPKSRIRGDTATWAALQVMPTHCPSGGMPDHRTEVLANKAWSRMRSRPEALKLMASRQGGASS